MPDIKLSYCSHFFILGFTEQLQLRYREVILAGALVFIFLLPEGVMAATIGQVR